MAGPCQALAHDQILWHHPKLHGSWPPAQVDLYFYDKITTFLVFVYLGQDLYQNVSRSICMQICYTDMLPFEDIPDDTVPVTAYLKVMYGLRVM